MAKEQDLSGIPDVDLSGVKQDIQDQQAQSAQATGEQQQYDLAQFKTPEALLQGYKEIQAAYTKTSQELKALKEKANPERAAQLEAELAQMREKLEQQELSSYRPQPSAQQPKDFENMWIEDPEQAIAAKVAEQVNIQRINDILAEEDAKNPSDFQQRYAYADMLAKNPQYAHLTATPAGVRKLFQMGDRLRDEQLQTSTKKALENVFGGPVDDEAIAKLRTLIKGGGGKTQNDTNNAYMPDSSTSTQTGADANTGPDYEAKVRQAVQKGDIDGVLDGMFKDILAE